MSKYLSSVIFVATFAVLFATGVQAAPTVDLTTDGATGQIGGAWFYEVGAASTGSGTIRSFVRISTNQAIEEGYNTDRRPVQYDENTSATFTRSLLLGDIPLVNLKGDGTLYREFLLDINENGQADGRFLSLDMMEIYQADQGNLTGHPNGLGTLVYDLDASTDNWILLDGTLNSGSGSGDMFAYIPDSVFTGEDYVYLYSMFGASENSAYRNNGGFEEWAVRLGVDTPPPHTPAPGALLLALVGIGLVGRPRNQHSV